MTRCYSSRETLDLKARVVPDCWNEWKVILDFSNDKVFRIMVKFFLNLESVNGTYCCLILT